MVDFKDYEIIATGNGQKLERWKDVYLLRPDPQIIWKEQFKLKGYKPLCAWYDRHNTGGGEWKFLKKVPESWVVEVAGLKFKICTMGFKHTGLFPEQAYNWEKMQTLIKNAGRPISVLNLFGYTGGATVACADAGAEVCHVDAAKNMVDRCKENIELSNLTNRKVRYIVDDCKKFVEREIRRGHKYDAIIMDPPSYGRGSNGEVWKLEDSICELVELCEKVLAEKPLFFLINSYTTGLSGMVMENILKLSLKGREGKFESYELSLPTSEKGIRLPCGNSAIFVGK